MKVVIGTLVVIAVLTCAVVMWQQAHDPVSEAKAAATQVGIRATRESNELMSQMHDLQLDSFERVYGRTARLRLEAYELRVIAEGVEAACKHRGYSGVECSAYENNRQVLWYSQSSRSDNPFKEYVTVPAFPNGPSKFVKPAKH